MRGNQLAAFLALLKKLDEGDPVAWGGVGLFFALAAVLGLLVLKARRDMRREDEARARKYGRIPK